MTERYYAICGGNLAVSILEIDANEMDRVVQNTMFKTRGLGITSIPVYFCKDGRLWPEPATNLVIVKEVELENGHLAHSE